MIGLNELYEALNDNEQKIAELQAENRVFDKLIAREKANEKTENCEPQAFEEPVVSAEDTI